MCIYQQGGLHYYSWMHSLRDDAGTLFPNLDGDASVEAS